MRLTEATVVIRPRTPLEAMDLGVLLARKHAGLLVSAWALLTLPLFALLSLLLWDTPGWAILIFWWLKPAYERLPLHILSRALFGETPSLTQSLRALPGMLRPALLPSLTWRRLNPTRSFDLPVIQLEGGNARTRQQRLTVLARHGGNRGAALLTLVGMHVELALWLGLAALLYLLTPQSDGTVLPNWRHLLEISDLQWLWLEHLSNLLYALVLTLWEPVYVACGFCLYLNRRTRLEGWDIELAFRRMRQRLTRTTIALPIVLGLLLAPIPDDTWAQGAEAEPPSLSLQTARDDIRTLLERPPFRRQETLTRWRFGEPPAKDEEQSDQLRPLAELFSAWHGLERLPALIELLLWTIVAALLVLLAWRYRDWLSVFTDRLSRATRRKHSAPQQSYGLPLEPHNLPDDIASEAERLWPQQPRQALALLYRGLLSRLQHDFHLPLSEAETESEVLARVRQLHRADLERFAEQLTQHWERLAYGHHRPSEQTGRELCAAWRRQFGQETLA